MVGLSALTFKTKGCGFPRRFESSGFQGVVSHPELVNPPTTLAKEPQLFSWRLWVILHGLKPELKPLPKSSWRPEGEGLGGLGLAFAVLDFEFYGPRFLAWTV